MKTQPPFRHTPTQKRSRTRVAAILKAAEQIFNEVGYEGATTNAIAERASIPIGSLYQYFKNKQAILYALTEAYAGELRIIVKTFFEERTDPTDVFDMSDILLERVLDFYRTHPAFQVVFYGSCRDPDLLRVSNDLRSEIMSHIRGALAIAMRERGMEDRSEIASIILVTVIRGAIPLAIGKNSTEDKEFIRELKRMSRAYLKASLEPDP
jgi:AcrR family transcriptional regulator